MDSWQPLAARSADAIVASHPNALRMLQDGEVPAIIVRRALHSSHARTITARLLKLWKQRSATFKAFGVDLHDCLRKEPRMEFRTYNNRTQAFKVDLDGLGLNAPVHLLWKVLTTLHSADYQHGRSTTLLNPTSASEFNAVSPGVFRSQLPGNEFAPHADTLNASTLVSKCGGRPKRVWQKRVTSQFRTYGALRQFSHQFSALVLLQQPESGGELRLFDTDYRSVECRSPGKPYLVGVFYDRWRLDVPAVRPRVINLTIGMGDVFIFNSNRVHEVLPIPAHERPRITLGSFVGYSRHKLAIWS